MKDKTLIKKTRQGKILKIVREHYLRDDLSCGSALCSLAVCRRDSSTSTMPLEAAPVSPSLLLADQPHYLLPDANLLLDQMDVLEDAVFKNVIVAQLVLNEIKQRSASCYQRLVHLLNTPDRHFYCFVNEYHK